MLARGGDHLSEQKVLRHSLMMIALTTGVNFFNYLYQVVMGRMLTPEQYGELLSLISLIAITGALGAVITTVVAKYISRFKAREEQEKISLYYYHSLKKTLILGACVFIVLSMLSPILASYLKIESHLVFIVLFSSQIVGFSLPAGFGMLMGLQEFLKLGLLLFFGAIIKFVVSVILVYLAYGVIGGVAGTTVSNIIVFTVLFLILKQYYVASEKTPDYQELRSYATFTLTVTFFMTVLTQVDVIFAKHYLSLQDAGLYASISVLGRIIFFSASGIGMVLFPKLSHAKEVGADPKKIVLTTVGLTVFIGGCILASYHYFPGLIIRFILGEKYLAAVPFLSRYGLAMLFMSILLLLSQIVLSFEMTALAPLFLLAVIAEIAAISFHHNGIGEVVNIFVAMSCVSTLVIGGGVWRSLTKAIKE